jgi:hypothetical protein
MQKDREETNPTKKEDKCNMKAVLVGFISVVVIQIQSFRHFQSLLSK